MTVERFNSNFDDGLEAVGGIDKASESGANRLERIRRFAALAAAGVLALGGCDRGTKKDKPSESQIAPCVSLELQEQHSAASRCFNGILDKNPDYHDAQLKDVTELAPDEMETVVTLCRMLLEERFGNGIVNRQRAEFHFMPESDDLPPGIPLSPSDNKLEHSVIFPSYIVLSSVPWREMQAVFRKVLATSEVVDGGKGYHVVKSLILIETPNIATGLPSELGAFGHSQYKVTIVPQKVAIYPHPER